MRVHRFFRAAAAVSLAIVPPDLQAQEKTLPQQIADVMVQLAGGIHPGLRFTHTKGLVANSHNGFYVGNGNDFLAFLKAVAATNEKSPHPSPIEQFLGTHPAALKVILDSKAAAKSFENLDFFGNNAFVFVDAAGGKHVGRYQIIPVAGVVKLDSASAAKQKPDYMFDHLKAAIAKGPVKYKLSAQLANPGDPTNDGSIMWPSDRKRVELGTISVTKVAANNDELQKTLAFNPIILTNGITLSDDPLPIIRSAVYALSVAHRR